MSLPAQWIDRIFEKMAIFYGRDWLSKWEGVDINAVKNDWAHELRGFAEHPEAIKHGLAYLPDKPPNVAQFRETCRKAPVKEFLKLGLPDLTAEQMEENRKKTADLLKLLKVKSVVDA